MPHARTLALALGVMASIPVEDARAQNSAAAEALFDKGLAALKANDFESACPLLEESHRLDPKPGVLFTLAACEAKRGRIATALTHYEDYLEIVSALPAGQRARQAARERVARRERDQLKTNVPMLTVSLPETAPESIVVKRDGQVMGRPSLGIPLPVDPGEHVVSVHSGEKTLLTERVVLQPKEQRTVQLPGTYALDPEPAPPKPPPPDTDVPVEVPLAVLGAGALGLTLGTIFGIMALNEKSTVDEECDGSACRSEEGREAGEDGRSFANVSTGGFIVGVLGVAAGVTLLLVRSDGLSRLGAKTNRPELIVGPQGAALRGTF